MNPAYLQLLQQKGLNRQVGGLVPKVQPLANTPAIQPQVPIRQQGFGGHFEDSPPEFLQTKTDNKIERIKKPEPKKKKRKKKRK
tara:strand:+ start:1798 stop:2049 length:252 start_codon:yes stop_codon:yes gene_type:complete